MNKKRLPECHNCGAPFAPEASSCLYCDTGKPPHLIITRAEKSRPAKKRTSLLSYFLLLTLIAVIIYSFSLINHSIKYRNYSSRTNTPPVIDFFQDVLKTFNIVEESKHERRQKRLSENMRPSGDNDLQFLNHGIRKFRVLNKNKLPTRFDSLIEVKNIATLAEASYVEIGLAGKHLGLAYLTGAQLQRKKYAGLDGLMYLDNSINPPGRGDCSRGELGDLLKSTFNLVSNETIFTQSSQKGCGVPVDFNSISPGQRLPIMVWTGGKERLTGRHQPSPYDKDGNTAFMVVGIGKSSNLFETSQHGSLRFFPSYPGSTRDSYHGYMAVFAIGRYKNSTIEINTQTFTFLGILGGHGQTTKEML